MTAFGDVVCSRQEMCLRYNLGGWSLERGGGSFLFSFFPRFEILSMMILRKIFTSDEMM